MTLRLGQQIDDRRDNRARVTFRLEGSPRELARIERVVYTCGPTFAQPVQVVTQREGGFPLELTAYGDFTLIASAVASGGGETVLEQVVRLTPMDSTGEQTVPARARPPAAARTSGRAALLRLYVTILTVLVLYLLVASWPDGSGRIRLFWGRFETVIPAQREIRLVLVALFAGGVGSLLQSSAALVTRPALRTLNAAWARWYLLRPLTGMALGLLAYLLARTVFFTAEAGPTAVSAVGVAALAGLMGVFSRAATSRLQQVAEALFSPGPEDLSPRDQSPADQVTARQSLRRSLMSTTQRTDKINLANAVLRGEGIEFQPLYDLAEALKDQREFGYARKLFGRARRHPDFSKHPKLRLKVSHREALCTYKDPDLPAGERFARALEILREVDDPVHSKDQETLGLTGAIYKRLWDVEGQIGHLQRSLGYYRRGYAQGATRDQGYTAINAAFVLDLLAREESREAQRAGQVSDMANGRREEARRIRQELTTLLPTLPSEPKMDWLEQEWWFFATIAEAHFGLGQYEQARDWLSRAAALPEVPPWEFESTTRQLATLAQLRVEEARERGRELVTDDGQDPADREQALAREEAAAWNVLHEFLGGRSPGVRSAFVGKLGVALSGGGFRASFFHIGVLAYLAERDALRSVEVLSCVSGGSIVGAHYYLEVRKLLQEKADADVTAGDYIDIVRRLEANFLAGVETNIRCQVLSEFGTNLRAMIWPGYTRTLRLGELYESELYSQVEDGEGDRPRHLSDLFVRPLGESKDFKPKYDNWSRRAKVPILVLNATTLNTGHNWQFTASWMGEPPAGIDSEIDGNYRLRRMYYSEAPRLREVWRRPLLRWLAPVDYRRIRLGHAVAASSCVPGLFEPLAFPKLYPGKTVRLVDGGVHDNQGVASLLEQDCSVLLVSDASGQMEPLDRPSDGRLAVPLRAFSVSMARVRQAEYHELDARRRSSLLRGLMFLHLKKDLDEDPVDWVDCEDPHDASDDARPMERRGILTRYGIRKDIQEKLSAIRTDLDSFSEVEAYSLMTSGYRMAEHEFGDCIEGFPELLGEPPAWRFLAIEPAMNPGPGFERVAKRLDVARQTFLKVWWLSTPLIAVAAILGIVLLGGLVWAWYRWGHVELALGTVREIGIWLLFLLLTLTLGPWLVRIVRFKRTLGQLGLVTAAALLASLAFKIHLAVFDRWFIRWGRLTNVLEK